MNLLGVYLCLMQDRCNILYLSRQLVIPGNCYDQYIDSDGPTKAAECANSRVRHHCYCNGNYNFRWVVTYHKTTKKTIA